MANLVETDQWEDGVYQLETSDPVVGGPDGIDNRQAKQLSNRTRYLKAQLEGHAGAANPHPQYATILQMTAAINTLVNAAPGALDTLKELADALGDDPNFATTMTNALALKAALDSPVFTGLPKGPSPARFDSSKLLATSEFVKSAGLQVGSIMTFTSSQVLNSTILGQHVFYQGASAGTLTLPMSTGLPAGAYGAHVVFFNASSFPLTLARQGATDVIICGPNNTLTSFVVQPGDTAVLMLTSANFWNFQLGSAKLPFSPLFAATRGDNGSQLLPGGTIFKWGLLNNVANATSSVTFPLAFPNSIRAVLLTGLQGAGNTQAYAVLNAKSLSGFTWSAFWATGGSAPALGNTAGNVQGHYFAIGD